jgi:hypothetical protein
VRPELQLLLWFPVAAAIVGLAYALAWFAGRWVGIGLTVAGIIGRVVFYTTFSQPIMRVRSESLDWSTFGVLGTALMASGATGPAMFGRRKAAAVSSVVMGGLAMFALPLFAEWLGLMRSGL